MIDYFYLHGPGSRRLTASDTVEDGQEVRVCPSTSGMSQHRSIRRTQDLALEVSHRKREELMIWSIDGLVMHNRLLDEFERKGFTGLRRRPATVRFRDGYLSMDYSEAIVTGWGGHARVESGIRLTEECAGCGSRRYTGLEDSSELIDWKQWSGDDFFIVWPLPNYRMITSRVADELASLGIRSYHLGSPSDLERRAQPDGLSVGYSVGPVSEHLPEDVALKYSNAYGLE